jgi:hypothetical protein
MQVRRMFRAPHLYLIDSTRQRPRRAGMRGLRHKSRHNFHAPRHRSGCRCLHHRKRENPSGSGGRQPPRGCGQRPRSCGWGWFCRLNPGGGRRPPARDGCPPYRVPGATCVASAGGTRGPFACGFGSAWFYARQQERRPAPFAGLLPCAGRCEDGSRSGTAEAFSVLTTAQKLGTGANSVLLRVTMPLGFTMLCSCTARASVSCWRATCFVQARSPVVRQ